MGEKFYRKFVRFSVAGVIFLVVAILVVIAFAIFDNEPSTSGDSGDTDGFGQTTEVPDSSCSSDADCSIYGANYTCISGTCYFYEISEEAPNKSSESVSLLGFFTKFFTGSAVSPEAGDVIYYNDGWVGIGTSEPENLLHLSSNDYAGLTLESGVSDWSEVNFYEGPIRKWAIGRAGDNSFRITESGVGSPFVIGSGGNVGIGAPNPGADFTVGRPGAEVVIGNPDIIGAYADADSVFELVSSNSAFLTLFGGMSGSDASSLLLTSTPAYNWTGIVSHKRGSGEVLPLSLDVTSSPGPELLITTGGDVALESLKGTYSGGEAYVCVSDDGTLFAKETACA